MRDDPSKLTLAGLIRKLKEAAEWHNDRELQRVAYELEDRLKSLPNDYGLPSYTTGERQ